MQAQPPAQVCLPLLLALSGLAANAADMSSGQKDGVCRTSLARINANAASDYKMEGVYGDTRRYTSKKGYPYDCEVFSDGHALTLSSAEWGRLKPTASISTTGKCSEIKLFDPGFGVTHTLKCCSSK